MPSFALAPNTSVHWKHLDRKSAKSEAKPHVAIPLPCPLGTASQPPSSSCTNTHMLSELSPSSRQTAKSGSDLAAGVPFTLAPNTSVHRTHLDRKSAKSETKPHVAILMPCPIGTPLVPSLVSRKPLAPPEATSATC